MYDMGATFGTAFHEMVAVSHWASERCRLMGSPFSDAWFRTFYPLVHVEA
jgi:hypothetical protein